MIYGSNRPKDGSSIFKGFCIWIHGKKEPYKWLSFLINLFYLTLRCRCIVSKQFGHPVFKFPVNLDTLLPNPGYNLQGWESSKGSRWQKGSQKGPSSLRTQGHLVCGLSFSLLNNPLHTLNLLVIALKWLCILSSKL